MPFLDKLSDLAKTAKSGAEDLMKNARSGAEDLVETTKLNSRINDEQRKISRIKTQIGQFIWEQYAAGTEGLPEGAVEFCRQIDQANESIAALNMQINAIKAQSNAARNGAEAPAPVPGSAPTQAPAPASATADTDTPAPANSSGAAFGNCFSCGAALEENAKFCAACGKAQPQAPAEDQVVDVEPEQAPRICPVCGREVPEGAAFCSVCGAKLDI